MEYIGSMRQQGHCRRPGLIWTLFMWCLCMIDWNHGIYEFGAGYPVDLSTSGPSYSIVTRRVMCMTSLLFHLSVAVGSIVTVVWRTACNIDSQAHFMFMASLLLFLAVIMSAPIVCIVAAVKRNFKRREWLWNSGIISWCRVFDEASFRIKIHTLEYRIQAVTPRVCAFIFFYSLATTNVVLEIFWFTQLKRNCRNSLTLLSLLILIINIFLYSTVCYFLYLQRKLLEAERNRAVEYIQKNIQDRGSCIMKAKCFFREYMQLRRIVFPWLNVVVFTTAFGMTFFLTWRLRIPLTTMPNTISSSLSDMEVQNKTNNLCQISCSKEMMENAHLSHYFILQVICEKIMVMIFAVVASGGKDLKHQWDLFKMKLYLLTNTEDASWKRLSDLIERMHPDTCSDVIASFLIPLIGVVAGVISGRYIP